MAINNVSVSTEYVTKLRQELDSYTGGLGCACAQCLQGAFVWQMLDVAVPRVTSCLQPALHVNRSSCTMIWVAGCGHFRCPFPPSASTIWATALMHASLLTSWVCGCMCLSLLSLQSVPLP